MTIAALILIYLLKKVYSLIQFIAEAIVELCIVLGRGIKYVAIGIVFVLVSPVIFIKWLRGSE